MRSHLGLGVLILCHRLVLTSFTVMFLLPAATRWLSHTQCTLTHSFLCAQSPGHQAAVHSPRQAPCTKGCCPLFYQTSLFQQHQAGWPMLRPKQGTVSEIFTIKNILKIEDHIATWRAHSTTSVNFT